jgi:hypothetical protein
MFTCYIISGIEKNGQEHVKVLLYCNEKTFSYISDLIFSKIEKSEEIGKKNIWNINKHLKQISSDIDVVFIESDIFYSSYFQKKGFITIPNWILTSLDISPEIEEVYNRFNKSIRKNIQKAILNGYYYEITSDINKLKYFYEHMYMDYTRQKFGKSAIVIDFNSMKSILKRGKLILVKDRGEYILGNLMILIDKKTIMLTHLGIALDKLEYLEKSVNVADYLFAIMWAKENNFERIHFGFCRSFLNDSILQHKRQWGVDIRPFDYKVSGNLVNGIFAMKILNLNKPIKSFLMNNPFIFTENNKFFSLVCIPENYNLSEKELNHYKKVYHFPGITDLIITNPCKIAEYKKIYI